MPAESDSLETGDVLEGRYKIVEKIGEGGFGEVYKATQTSTGQFVAIKVLHPEVFGDDLKSKKESARFEREMKLIAKLKHPNIVRLIDSGELKSGALFTVLEYIEGETLAQYIETQGPMEPKETKRLMLQVADSLCCAHANGIVHRDLKPANIMVTDTGGRRNAMVLDFGIASVTKEARDRDYHTLTEDGKFRGTPAYMAPEQLEGGDIQPHSDIYAWGLVFLECLVGRPIYASESVYQIIFAQMSETPVPIPERLHDHPLGRLLARATAKPIELRYGRAQDLLSDLEECSVKGLSSAEIALDLGDLSTGRVWASQSGSGEDAHGRTATQPGALLGLKRNTQEGDDNPTTSDQASVDGDLPSGPHSPASVSAALLGADDTLDASGIMPKAVRPDASGELDAVGTGPGGSGAKLALVALVVLAIVGAVAFALTSGPTETSAGSVETTDAPQTSVPTTSAPRPDTTTSSDQPDTALPPPETQAALPPPPASYALIDVSPQRVTIGVDGEILSAFSKEFPDNIFDLDYSSGIARSTSVELPALAVMETEVTWRLWDLDPAVLDKVDAVCPDPVPRGGEPAFAVGGVGAKEATAFCAELGMRLPTGQEWEALARGTARRAYPVNGEMTAERVQALAVKVPAGERDWNVTPEGAKDMAGGVAEWVTCTTDQWGYCSSEGFGYRGGSWASAPFWRLAFVMGFNEEFPKASYGCGRQPDIGFRCVK